jgi:hypothetical protein
MAQLLQVRKLGMLSALSGRFGAHHGKIMDKVDDIMLSGDPEGVLRAARLSCLNDMEQYFEDGADGHAVISFRNEAAAVSLVLQRLNTADGEERRHGMEGGACTW